MNNIKLCFIFGHMFNYWNQSWREKKKENIEEIHCPGIVCGRHSDGSLSDARCSHGHYWGRHSSRSAFLKEWEQEASPSADQQGPALARWEASCHWAYPNPWGTRALNCSQETVQVEKLCFSASEDKGMSWVFWFKIYGYESGKESEINVACFSLLPKRPPSRLL